MKKTMISAGALIAALALSGGAFAQVPSGGADAKGNAPLKHAHTINDGGAKRGATSFTEKQAQRHIEHAGYSAVSPLTKGDDGVWRGTASKNGATVNVGLDFKGNVVEAGPAGGAMTGSSTTTTRTTAAPAPMPVAAAPAPAATTTSTTTDSASKTTMTHHRMHHRHHRRHHHHRHHMAASCAKPAPNGAACSGVDRNMNGISDKEDRAISAGAKP